MMKFLLLIVLFVANLFAWDDALLDAMHALNRDSATPKQKAMILQNNAVINQMRIKGQVSDKTYQKTQNYYSDFVQDLGAKVCKKNGTTMIVQKRDMTKSYDAGTDSDFITKATSVEQVKSIQSDFNTEFEDHLKKQGLDVSKGTNWTAVNDVDFMVDPDGVDRKTFEKIAKIQNDAYSDPDSARYEIKSRNGKQPSLKEIAAYKDEMGRFIDKKKVKSIKLSEELMEMKKKPNFNKEGTPQWKKRQLTEAKLQQINAQNSKYQDRAIDANSRMAHILGIDISSSDLPSRGKTRAPDLENSVQKRAILSASLNAANKHLTSQSKLNEALLLSVQATNEPQNAKEIQKRISKVTHELSPSQKGEFMERIRNTNGVSDETVKSINKTMKKQTPNFVKKPLQVKSSKLLKVGGAFGVVGDLMSISGQLGKASRGEHLLVNIDKKDSASFKALKQASVALLELAPVPIMDTLTHYDAADKKAKEMMLKAIKRGDYISPTVIATMVFSDVAGQTLNDMVLNPLFQGKEAITEGVKTTTTIVKNYENKKILEKDDKKNTKKFNEYVTRVEKINLGQISTKASSKDGSSYTVLDNVQKGDRVYFFIPKSSSWKSNYKTSWEIRKGGAVVQKNSRVSATSKNSNRFAFTNSLSNGNYQVIFRIFNENDKQMDSASSGMRVNQRFGMSSIMILNSSRKQVSSSGIKQDKKYMFGINPIGAWGSDYRVEWFLDSDRIKSSSADASKLQSVWIHFDDYVGSGRHTVSVRAIKKGKVVSHQSVSLNIKAKKQKKKSAKEKLADLLNKDKNRKSGSKNSSLDDIISSSEKEIATIEASGDEKAYKEALAKIARLKREMAQMDRDDAAFWSGLVQGVAIAGKAVGEGAKEYQKSSSQKESHKLKSDPWNGDDDDKAWNSQLASASKSKENKKQTKNTSNESDDYEYIYLDMYINNYKTGCNLCSELKKDGYSINDQFRMTICGEDVCCTKHRQRANEIISDLKRYKSLKYFQMKEMSKKGKNKEIVRRVICTIGKPSRSKKSDPCAASRCWKNSTFNGNKIKYQYIMKNGNEVRDGQFTMYRKKDVYKKGVYKNGCKDGTWIHYHTTYEENEPFREIVVYENCSIKSSKRLQGH